MNKKDKSLLQALPKSNFRLSLSIKMLAATIAVGMLVWLVLSFQQSRELKKNFLEELSLELSKQEKKDRYRFNQYINWHNKATKLIISQKRFINYTKNSDWKSVQKTGQIKHYYLMPPPWMPQTSVLRIFYSARLAILIDSTGIVREIYHIDNQKESELPEILLRPDSLLSKLSHNQSYMTSIEDSPYILATQNFDQKGKRIATLMLVSPMDSEFLTLSQELYGNENIIALINPKTQIVVSSSDEENIPRNSRVSDLSKKYLMSDRTDRTFLDFSVFDYGASDLELEFISFLPMQKVERLTNRILKKNNQQRTILVAVLVLFFSFLILWVLRRIKRLTNNIAHFSVDELVSTAIESLGPNSDKDRNLVIDSVPKLVVDSRDEIGQMAASFNKMIENLTKATVSKNYVDKILASMNEMMIVFSPECVEGKSDQMNIKTLNHAACKILEYSETELQGKPVSALFVERPPLSSDECKILVVNGVLSLKEKEMLTKNGDKIPVLFSVSLMKEENKKIIGIVFIAQDIRERKKLNRLKKEFVSTVSHELRTPLTSIHGALGLVQGGIGGKIPEKAKNLIEVAYRNSERLVRLVNDILDLEKIEAGKMAFHLQEYNLAILVQQVIESNEPLAEQYGVTLHFCNNPGRSTASVDSDRFAQLMTNLIFNAVKFSPKGEQVDIELQHINKRIRISIADCGPGIPKEFQPYIFQKFTQADSSDSRKSGGTGLGLAICTKIIDNFKGRIWFETEIGKGTIFYFDVPEKQ